MITEEQYMVLILEKFPNFKKMWSEHLEWWGDEKAGLSNDMAVFSRYTIELLKNSEINHTELHEIFILIEKFMTDGSENLKDAVATCFLENIINATSWKTVNPLSFVNLLGAESKNFCKAWDEYTGVKTEGLWDDQKPDNK